MMRNWLLTFLMMVGLLLAGGARADIMISPIYIIFEGRTRSAEVTLLNTTKETNVYRLEWKLSRQKEDGSYEFLDQPLPGQIDPREFVRFSPRQITLQPNTRQLVRVTLQKPADLPAGEYRLHLQFKRLPNEKSLAESAQSGQGMSMEFRVTLGVAMPVVIRHGDYNSKTEIVDAKFIDRRAEGDVKTPELMVRINRSGLHGTYGRLRAFWIKDGKSTQLGMLNNFSIFGDNASRVGYIPLAVEQISGGKVRIVYEADGPQRGQVFTEQTIQVGG